MPEAVLKQKYFYGLPLKKILRTLPGNTEIRQIHISGLSFGLECVVNQEKLLNVLENNLFRIDERLPYWSELWPSSLALAEYILENRSQFAEKLILEIGCGLGLAGLAGKRAGACIHFTDNDPIALYFAKRNYQRNFQDPAAVYYLDWRGPYPALKFDVIIGADVLYENRFFQPLSVLLGTMLRPAGQFIIAEPGRTVAEGFFKLFSSDEWTGEVTEKIVEVEKTLKTVNIHHYRTC